MLEAARQRGITELGISEHIYQTFEGKRLLPHLPQEGPLITLADYVAAVRGAQMTGVQARLGLEVDYIPGTESAIAALLEGVEWDFMIGSVHEVDGVQFEAEQCGWEPEAGQAIWRRYIGLLREAATSGRFDIISHPVRMHLRNPHLPPDFDALLAALAADAARCDVALELNGKDLSIYPDVVRHLARACATYTTPISVGSDAHRPARIAVSHAGSATILAEGGIRSIRTFEKRRTGEYVI